MNIKKRNLNPLILRLVLAVVVLLFDYLAQAQANDLPEEIAAKCLLEYPVEPPGLSLQKLDEHCKRSMKAGADSRHHRGNNSTHPTKEPEKKEPSHTGACKSTWTKVRELRESLLKQSREICLIQSRIPAQREQNSRSGTNVMLDLASRMGNTIKKMEEQNKSIATWLQPETLNSHEKENLNVMEAYLSNMEKIKTANDEVAKSVKHEPTRKNVWHSECGHTLHRSKVNQLSKADLNIESVSSACEIAKVHKHQEISLAKSNISRLKATTEPSSINFKSPLFQEQNAAIQAVRVFRSDVTKKVAENEAEMKRLKTYKDELQTLAERNGAAPGQTKDVDGSGRDRGGSNGVTSNTTTGSSFFSGLPLSTMIQAGAMLAPFLMQKDQPTEAPQQPPTPPVAASPKDTILDSPVAARTEASSSPVKKDDGKSISDTSLKGVAGNDSSGNSYAQTARSSVGPLTAGSTFTPRVSKVDGGGSSGPSIPTSPASEKFTEVVEGKKSTEGGTVHDSTEEGAIELGNGNSPGSSGSDSDKEASSDSGGGSSAVDDLLKTMEGSLKPNNGNEVASGSAEIPSTDEASENPVEGEIEPTQAETAGNNNEIDIPLFTRIRNAHNRCIKTGCLIFRTPKKLNKNLEQEDAS